MTKYKKLDFRKVKTYALKERKSKVSTDTFAAVTGPNPSFEEFMGSIPGILSGKDFHEFVSSCADAITNQSSFIFMMGAHVIKVGLSPILLDAMEKGWITHLALNGACVIHDVEIALGGSTSEDVAEGLRDGSFGMVEESTHFINESVAAGKNKLGYGESVAAALQKSNAEFLHLSLLAKAYELDIPLTVHSALGTEIIHQHPGVDAEAVGDTSWTDFQIFSHSVSLLDAKSVVLNVGSAVIMPEVFLKALTVARNLKHNAFGFTTANFDMIRHYRPMENVVKRPTQGNGRGYNFIGHHELMLPLLFTAIKSRLS